MSTSKTKNVKRSKAEKKPGRKLSELSTKPHRKKAKINLVISEEELNQPSQHEIDCVLDRMMEVEKQLFGDF